MKIMGEVSDIPCTACSYCTGGCPQGIPVIKELKRAAEMFEK